MLSDKEKYQNIISQIHELNRQNLLAENEKNDLILNKFDILENKLNSKNTDLFNDISSSMLKKGFYILIILLVLNLILSFTLIILNIDSSNTQQQVNSSAQDDIPMAQNDTVFNNHTEDQDNNNKDADETLIIEENTKQTDDVVSFEMNVTHNEDQSSLDDNQTDFEEIKPIIKKDTVYKCEDDNFIQEYKIPYTVEIKGKLYNDKFIFILQDNVSTKKCKIDKGDI